MLPVRSHLLLFFVSRRLLEPLHLRLLLLSHDVAMAGIGRRRPEPVAFHRNAVHFVWVLKAFIVILLIHLGGYICSVALEVEFWHLGRAGDLALLL